MSTRTSAPTRAPMKAPTRAPTKIVFSCSLPFKDSPRKLARNVPRRRPLKCPRKVSTQVVEVHLSCFHLFCSSTRKPIGPGQTAKSTHHPHKIDDQHRKCKKWGWCVPKGPTIVRRPHSTYQKVVQGKRPLQFLRFTGAVCSNTIFSNNSALASSLLPVFRANSSCKSSRTPRLVEHFWFQFWGPLARTTVLSALCSQPRLKKEIPIDALEIINPGLKVSIWLEIFNLRLVA